MSNEVDACRSVERYKPPPEFEEDKRELLTDMSLSNCAELWLIQWPANQAPDFDGQELSLQLHPDGHLGSFNGSSGKSYDVVSWVAQEPEASVFLPSSSDSKLVGFGRELPSRLSRPLNSIFIITQPHHINHVNRLNPAFPIKKAHSKAKVPVIGFRAPAISYSAFFRGNTKKCRKNPPKKIVIQPTIIPDTDLVPLLALKFRKIIRRISLVHYPKPEELEKATPLKSVYKKSSGISLSRQTTTSRGPNSSSRRTSSTRSSKPRSSVSEFEEPSNPLSVKQKPEPTESRDHSPKDSSKRKRTH
ncbi:hypothetical protein SDJN02_13630 [Cucurbita argyrosperma subsp. argyrosperma]|nr:hypothetical protein SDJN02_13630 [Cucurbita argyrosperma subsp. argyrosperma]